MSNFFSKDSLQNDTLDSTEDQHYDCVNSSPDLPSKQRQSSLQRRMQRCLDLLGVPLRVAWMPNGNSAKRGEIESGCLIVYDEAVADAWETLEHEVYEWKLREVTHIYRTVINSLIESVEKLTYRNKEAFIESLPRVSEVVRKEKSRPQPPPPRTLHPTSTQN